MSDNRLEYLVNYLLSERGEEHIPVFKSENDLFNLYRSLVNVRLPQPISEEYLKTEDEYLSELNKNRGITDFKSLKPIDKGIYLWRGDITTLRCDAIINAANSQMTGCYQPCHNCIDNCIHTFSGVRLRLNCHEIMQKQGFLEPTGKAKITPAFNLPSKFVIHTVGPMVSGNLTDMHSSQLASCYNSCLQLATDKGLKSIAFCCISTGVFGFPNLPAAKIAVSTVKNFIKTNNIEVIFNVFTEQDYDIYRQLLGGNNQT